MLTGLTSTLSDGAAAQFAAIQTVAQSLRVEVNLVNLRDPGEIERGIAAFARAPNGGLISYGADAPEVGYRQAASYVDRILRGEKPAKLPVQAPTKYELVINLKTAKVLGLTIPESFLNLTDAVIE